MSGIEWVIFSKDRTLQLKSCIMSLLALSDVTPEDITILYVDSPRISYEPLKKQFQCRFVRQKDFFNDIKGVVAGSRKWLVGFVVDDLIFRDIFGSKEIEEAMQIHGLDCFSLRLGRHIKSGRQPDFEQVGPGIISWKTAAGLGRAWNYFWELSGSVYPKEAVLDYIARCGPKGVTYPNPLESRYYDIMPNFFIASCGILKALARPQAIYWNIFCRGRMSKKMACYDKSRAFTQGVNLVASRRLHYDTYLSCEKLNELFLEGRRIDFEGLKDVLNENPNAGRKYFRLKI